MSTIETSDWGEFRIDHYFKLVKGSRLTSLDRVEGETPYVGASQFNNGITQFIGNNENLHPAGVLTVCYNGPVGATFYQPREFWATDDVNVLYPKTKMSMECMLFIAPMIERAGSEYAYIDKWKMTDMGAAIIRLPVVASGDPDWDHMERAMRKIMGHQEQGLDELISVVTSSGKQLSIDGWEPFRIGILFDVMKGSRLRSLDRVEGDVPYVGASLFNNGYTHMISNDEHIHPGNVLTTAYNGTIPGKTFYQPIPFWATDDVNVLYPKFEMTVESGLFIAPLIEAAGKNYVYVDKWKLQDMIDAVIFLPVTSEGNPDWDYMEQTMRQIIAEREAALDSLQSLVAEV